MMKTLLFIAFFSNVSLLLYAQDSTADSLTHLYPFNRQVFNLKTLSYLDGENLLPHSFKTDSKYAVRYKGLAMDKIAYQGILFEALEDNSLLYRNLETKAVIPIPNKEKGLPVQGHSLLLEATNGIVFIKPLKADNGFMIYKYNAKGEEVFSVQLPHSEFVQHGELTYHLPYLGYTMHTANTIVFSSYVDRIPKTVTVSALDGSKAQFPFSSIGVIRDAAMDMDVHGFIQLDRAKSRLMITYISDNFPVEHSSLKDITHAESLLLDQTLIIAAYNKRTPKVQLLAIDLATKNIKWEKTVAQLAGTVSSAHFNAIWLGAYQDKIILEGYERNGKYLQVFDKQTGNLIWKSF